ncbi:MAG: radical SAM protein [Clostridium perfringens]|nr:radical SAM protein [Clostridium perfringens]
MKLKCNCCDGIYNSFDVHFTSVCDNKCEFCIDQTCEGKNIVKPNVPAIVNTVIQNEEGHDDILFLGGEPCLFLDELIDCVTQIKEKTNLKVYVTTSVPKVCYDNKDKFFKLIETLDGINLSVQHYNEEVADKIRRTTSKYDRQKFYSSLPHKEKIRLNINLVKPYLCTKQDVIDCIKHYDNMGFDTIKLNELQHATNTYVSFEKLFDIKLKSPFSNGCQGYINMDKLIPNVKTPILLKRSCFLCEETQKARLIDGVKVLTKFFINGKSNFGVIYEDGSLQKGWI